RRPRGYPGDALLLDFVYGGGTSAPLVKSASPLGAALYHEWDPYPALGAIRGRRDYLAGRLMEFGGKEVLSVACGHLREAQALDGVPERDRPARFVALDQDPATLEVVRAEQQTNGVQTVAASVLDLLRPGNRLGAFDFIYSAGLYDYLSGEVGLRLLHKLVQ